MTGTYRTAEACARAILARAGFFIGKKNGLVLDFRGNRIGYVAALTRGMLTAGDIRRRPSGRFQSAV